MKTVGVDLAADPKRTGLCTIDVIVEAIAQSLDSRPDRPPNNAKRDGWIHIPTGDLPAIITGCC